MHVSGMDGNWNTPAVLRAWHPASSARGAVGAHIMNG